MLTCRHASSPSYPIRTHRQSGTLWDSRYKSSVIQADTYLLTCQRYIELNPVRAAMVSDPAHYRWTSYRHNALGAADSLMTPHALYLALGSSDKARQARTSAFCSTSAPAKVTGAIAPSSVKGVTTQI